MAAISLRRRLREASARAAAVAAVSPYTEERHALSLPGDAAHVVPSKAPAQMSLVIDQPLSGDECAEEVVEGLTPGVLCFDLEATGLGGTHKIFLAGFLYRDERQCRLVQYVAADPWEERALLIETARLFASHSTVMTYNGSTFDLPLLRKRAHYHSLPEPSRPPNHRDLLHATRRRFGKRLTNCRLATVERELVGVQRDGRDVSGAEVPRCFLEFLAERDLRWLQPVLYHNRMDVISLARLNFKLTEGAARTVPPPIDI